MKNLNYSILQCQYDPSEILLNKHVLLLSVSKTVVLLLNIFVEIMIDFLMKRKF